MNAKEFLNTALGGNMNFGTLKPLAVEEIMEQYARQKNKERASVPLDLLVGLNWQPVDGAPNVHNKLPLPAEQLL